MRCNCVERFLSRFYFELGSTIARHPYMFILVPIVITAVLCVGVVHLTTEEEVEYLYVPADSVSLKDRATIEKLFPMNTSSNFDVSRITRLENYGAVIITAKDGGTMLREHVFQDVVDVDRVIYNISINHNQTTYTYEELCARNKGKCEANEVLKLSWKIKDIEQQKSRIKYPIDYSNATYNYTIYVKNIGGVVTNNDGEIIDAKAIRLFYYLRNDNNEQKILAMKWEEKFIYEIGKTNFQAISVSRISKSSFDSSVTMHMRITLPLGIITGVILFIYSILACMTSDWVRSKPWLGVAGSSAVGLAIASTFGSMGYCGVTFNMIVMMVTFLTMGIGMDDAFVLIAAWRRTSSTNTVVNRLGSAYSEAAISITITSVTNALCFCIGITTPFPGIRNFCLYATLAIVFTYLYTVTFFGGCMALSGYREEKNLHAFTFQPVPLCGEVQKGRLYEIFCTRNTQDGSYQYHNTLPVRIMDALGNVIVHTISKIVIIFILIIYIAVSIWSICHISEGLDYNSVFPYDTYPTKFMNDTYNYFTQYPHRIQIAITETLDYSDIAVQKQIEKMVQKFEAIPYIAQASYTESWLRYYSIFNNSTMAQVLLHGYNMSNKQDFIDGLYYVFLQYPQTSHLRQDVVFNENHTEIIASRFMIQSINVSNSSAEKNLLETLREVTKNVNLSIAIHNEWFPLHEQLLLVTTVSVRTICIAAIVTLGTFFLFIPDIKLAVSVMFAVLSIEVGTIGFMSFWNVNLDVVSMVCLIMCVGFSVDYTAHMCFAYAKSHEKSSDKRFQEALNAVGIPIIQGGVTTVLGVIALSFAHAYSLLVFFKVIFLVAVLAVVHAIFVLPIFFTFCNIRCRKKHNKENVLLAFTGQQGEEIKNNVKQEVVENNGNALKSCNGI